MRSDGYQVFFVVGRGRSGTTLLARMLARHPAMDVAPEGFFIMNLRARYKRGPWSVNRVNDFCRDLLVENRMRTWNLDLDHVRAGLLARLPQLDFPAACRVVYASYAERTRERPEVRLVGDKNPHYALFASPLQDMFHEARFLHIIRDPRDNVMSYRKVPFDVSNVAALAYRWRHYNRMILDATARTPQQFHRVFYEQLVREPERVLREICDFLSQPYDPALLTFSDDEPEGFYGEGSEWFEKLAGPLDAKQAGKWESAMSDREIATVEAVAGPLMGELGYERSGRGRPCGGWRAGALAGWSTVVAERVLFGPIPAHWRTRVINASRARSGRV